jgi:environmental stress-induced protein Ves
VLLRRFEDQQVVPWRNGGGITREIAVSTGADSPFEMLWRVSAATVAAAGPFSRFEGIDRTLAVIAGNGLVLVTGADRVTLTTDTPPYAFDGETEIHAYNVDGATIDLNVMTRRGHFVHSIKRIRRAAPVTITGRQDVTTMLFFCGEAEISAAGINATARMGDALVDIGSGDVVRLNARTGVDAYLIEIALAHPR